MDILRTWQPLFLIEFSSKYCSNVYTNIGFSEAIFSVYYTPADRVRVTVTEAPADALTSP
jgi:hypothetical protein